MLPDPVTFESDGVLLRGHVYAQPAPGSPVIVMAHGLSGVAAQLRPQAEAFHAAGFTVLLFDHPGFGRSGGYPRQEVDPVRQMRAYRDAISAARALPHVNAEAIGLWGTSLSGGHVLQVAALDLRVKAVAAQVPFISGGRIQAGRQKLRLSLIAERERRASGGAPSMIAVTAADDSFAALPGPEAHAYFAKGDTGWLNQISFSSFELIGAHEPGFWISRISPRPLLMLVASDDPVTPHDHALEAFGSAAEPKTLVRIPGGHFSPYEGEGFALAMAEATTFFRRSLLA